MQEFHSKGQIMKRKDYSKKIAEKCEKFLSFCRDRRRPSRAVKGSFEPNFGNLRSAGKESECRRREEEDSRKKRNLLLPARSGKKEISVIPPDIRVRAQAVRSAKEASEKKTPSRLTPPFFAWGANILVRSDFLAPNPRKKNGPIIPARGKSIQINFPISRKKPFLPYFVKLPRLARRISPDAKLSLFRNGPIRTGRRAGSLFPFFPEDEAETSLFRRQKEL